MNDDPPRTRWDLRTSDMRFPELDPATTALVVVPEGPTPLDRTLRKVGGVLVWALAAVFFLAIAASAVLTVVAVVLLVVVVLAGWMPWPIAVLIVGLPGAALVAHAVSQFAEGGR